MPGIATVGDTANHDPPDGWSVSTITEGSPDTFVNGKAVARQDDALTGHTDGDTVHFSGIATPTISGGSDTVFVNGKPIARVDDSVDCGSKILSGSSNVNAN